MKNFIKRNPYTFGFAVVLALAVAFWLFPRISGTAGGTAPKENTTVQTTTQQVETPQTDGEPTQTDGEIVFDETDTRGAQEYTDEELCYWSRGTFDTPQDSLTYHFKKHGAELPADTVAAYLNAAYATRDEVLQSTDGWRITESTGDDAAHKYKNYDDDRFIIMDDDTHMIYSFGR